MQSLDVYDFTVPRLLNAIQLDTGLDFATPCRSAIG